MVISNKKCDSFEAQKRHKISDFFRIISEVFDSAMKYEVIDNIIKYEYVKR